MAQLSEASAQALDDPADVAPVRRAAPLPRYVLITAARNGRGLHREDDRIRRRADRAPRTMGDRGRWLNGPDRGHRDRVRSEREMDRAGPAATSQRAAFRGKGPRLQCGPRTSDVGAVPDRRKPRCGRFGWNLTTSSSFSPGSREDRRLGVAGTVYTQPNFDSMTDSFEGEHSVAGPVQILPVRVLRDIGGYVPNRLGAIDWIAVTTARMKGWTTRTFTERRFHHHRSMGTAERTGVQAAFDYGVKDYFMGGSPLWQVCRSAYQMTRSPLRGVGLLGGFAWGMLRRVTGRSAVN